MVFSTFRNNNNTDSNLFEQFKLELQQILNQQQQQQSSNQSLSNHYHHYSHQNWWSSTQLSSSLFPLKLNEIKTINVMIDSSAQHQQTSSYQQQQQQRTQYSPVINLDENLDALFICESFGGK